MVIYFFSWINSIVVGEKRGGVASVFGNLRVGVILFCADGSW